MNGTHLPCENKDISHEHAAHEDENRCCDGPAATEMQFPRWGLLTRVSKNGYSSTWCCYCCSVHTRNELGVAEKQRKCFIDFDCQGKQQPQTHKEHPKQNCEGSAKH